jgi:hypothetical protein
MSQPAAAAIEWWDTVRAKNGLAPPTGEVQLIHQSAAKAQSTATPFRLATSPVNSGHQVLPIRLRELILPRHLVLPGHPGVLAPLGLRPKSTVPVHPVSN